MAGIENVILGLWLLPVTLFIIIPLAMLVAWIAFRAIQSIFGSRTVIEKTRDEDIVDSGLLTKASM